MSVLRADKAGVLLADALLSGSHGDRPVTLVGASLGARVVFSCLEELARRGDTGELPGSALVSISVRGPRLTSD